MALNKGIKKIAGCRLAASVAELHLPQGGVASHFKNSEVGENILFDFLGLNISLYEHKCVTVLFGIVYEV